MNYLEKINTIANKILMILGGVSELLLMVIATVNVVMRIVHIPYKGTYEIVSYSGALALAFALGYAQKRKDHIIVDYFTEKLSERANRILDGVNYFISAILFAIISWQVCSWGMKIWKSAQVSDGLKIPFYPFIFCVSAGIALLSFTLIIDFIKNLKGKME